MHVILLKDELWEMWIPEHKRIWARDGWDLQLPSTAPQCWRTLAVQKWKRDHPNQQ